MDAFAEQVVSRLPLAEATWRMLRYALDDKFLGDLFQRHRGCGSEQKVTFGALVALICDALSHHQGSGRRSFHAARQAGRLAATDQAVYGKLRRVPVALSEALLREAAKRLRSLLPNVPDQEPVAALAGYRVVVVDGKKLKQLPKRSKPLRGLAGKALGGKALVGLALDESLVIAMQASPDGEANDAPLTPGLIAQLEADGSDERPLLVIADRQFCDLKIPRRLADAGHAFLIRYSKKMLFSAENESAFTDATGRPARQALGWLGRAGDERRLFVRQITLERAAEEPVVLVTNLLDDQAASAAHLLEAYRARWTVERVFQQVTEVFGLETLIGSTPQGAIFQFALCALLYDLIQVTKRYLAAAQARSPQSLSGEMIFRDVQEQLIACLTLTSVDEVLAFLDQPPQASDQLVAQLQRLLTGPWSNLWIKAVGPRRRPPPPQQPSPGGHFSAWKILKQQRPQTNQT
jgi:hypothetical protein